MKRLNVRALDPEVGNAGKALVVAADGSKVEFGDPASGGLTEEQVRDLVAAFLVQGANVTITHDDALDTLTIASTGGGGGAAALDDLTDVDTTTTAPTAGQALVWDDGAGQWAPGDVAAGGGGGVGGGSYTLLGATTLAANATGISLADIPAGYDELLVRAYIRNSTANNNRYVSLRVGTGGVVDTGANYNGQSLSMSVTGSPSGSVDNNANAFIMRAAMKTNAGPDACIEYRILKYAEPGNDRAMFARSSATGAVAGGTWKNTTDAIDIVEVLNLEAGEALLAGARLEVYGLSLDGGSGGGGSSFLGFAAGTSASGGSYDTTSTTAVDVDPTLLSVTFTAPASGEVLVTLNAYAGSTGGNHLWGVREGSTLLQEKYVFIGSGYGPRTVTLYLTGLTPGDSYTYKWAARATSGTGSIYYGGAAGIPTMSVEALGESSGGGSGGGGGSSLLARKVHNPGTLESYSTTSTSDADVDATDLELTFTAPDSGAVTVLLAAMCGQTGAVNAAMRWMLRDTAGATVTGTKFDVFSNQAGRSMRTLRIPLTGLTPGDSYTYRWGWNVESGMTGVMYAGGSIAPAVMEAWDTATGTGGGGGGAVGQMTELRLSADGSIPNSVWTPVAWPTETLDELGMHDTGANTTRVTVPTGQGGTYLVHFFCALQAGGTRYLALHKNGAVHPGRVNLDGTEGELSQVMRLAAGDYIEAAVYQNSGASRTLYASTGDQVTKLTVTRIA